MSHSKKAEIYPMLFLMKDENENQNQKNLITSWSTGHARLKKKWKLRFQQKKGVV